jgi:hypothetical protein
MSAKAETLRGRRRAEAEMRDTCTVRRATGATTTDPTTGKVTDVMQTVYSGKCKFKVGIYATRNVSAGEALWVESKPQLHLPMSATGVRVGDVATIDTSELDPDLPGTVVRIDGPSHGSHLTARRFSCTEGGPDE